MILAFSTVAVVAVAAVLIVALIALIYLLPSRGQKTSLTARRSFRGERLPLSVLGFRRCLEHFP